MRTWRRRDGQIVIPAMLIFPALMLFVFLIYETAKLSREKIRHQFAMDAAAFVEMTNYSDFLNRTAYVNGAFPMRIFDEAFGGDYVAEDRGKLGSAEKVTYAYLLFNNGVFPHKDGTYPKGNHQAEQDMTGNKWEIKYGGPDADAKNAADPTLPEPLRFTTEQNVKEYWIHKDLTYDFYKLYVQIYSLLGSVESAQYTVLKRLAGDHSFMKKSYWLNTGEPEGDLLVASFRSSQMPDFTSHNVVKGKCQHTLDYCGFSVSHGLQLETPECIMGAGTAPPLDLNTLADSGCKDLGETGGLFQFVAITSDKLKPTQAANSDSGYPGISLRMHWAIPVKNYWNVDLASDMVQRFPAGTLHTTISLKGDPSSEPSVWPDPTPKFQVRQFP